MAIELADELEACPPIAIEFVNTSLTSQNLDDKLGWAPLTESLPIAAEYIRDMPYIQWADFDSHGYTIVDVTRERITAGWWAVETVLERTDVERRVAAWSARAGEIALERVGEAVPDQVTAAGT